MKIRLLLASTLLAASTGLAGAQTTPPPGGAMTGARPMAACRDDMQKFCADKTGPDRRACMRDNRDKLSDACKQAIAARMQSR
jgi:hypothetical protein